MKPSQAELVEEILSRGVVEVIDHNYLRERLLSGEKLRIKLGIDPTSPNIHLGRAVPLLKLKDFQDLGHKIVFIIGDFTGVIGDTSDKTSERPMLEKETVAENLKTYLDQTGKILDMSQVEVRYNSEWLQGLTYQEICEQANAFSLAEFIARKNIKDRLDEGKRISLRELFYPLMQGYDSVMIKADVELGGSDQWFNLLAGRTLQQHYGQKPQDVLTTNLIMGLDGRKMSSSWGNTINLLDSPKDMFGKVMSMTDNEIISYFIHCTRIPMDVVKEHEEALKQGTNPRDVKMKLAHEITRMYWGENGAAEGEGYFKQVFQNKDLPRDIPELKVESRNIVDVLIAAGLVKSKSEARRLIMEGGIYVNNKTVTENEYEVPPDALLQKGKREFRKIL
jgi:tyrosyl-tRNA synthetase